MSGKVFFSHRMEGLVDLLVEEMDKTPLSPFEMRTLIVPNRQVREWLLVEIARRKGIAMGLKLVEIHELFPFSISHLELFSHLYRALFENRDPSVASYIQGKKKRALELAKELTPLFFQYGQFDLSLFSKQGKGWQTDLLYRFFSQEEHRMPVQQNLEIQGEAICFGIDYLPPIYWEALFRSPRLSVYLFSPCSLFWEDLRSDRERRGLLRYLEKRGASKQTRDELDAYLQEAPKNLANWGRLGRETLRVFDLFSFAAYDFYPPLEPDTLLHEIQSNLLYFRETPLSRIDDSIKILSTGSSLLREVEILKEEILKLKIDYREIQVLAPDIEPYAPLIEFVFSPDIPYRISGIGRGAESPFRQGLIRLFRLSKGRWGREEVLSLFETSSFYRKQGWDLETLQQYRSWIEASRIDWGIDRAHREGVLQNLLGGSCYEDRGSWEYGLDWLLHQATHLGELQIDLDRFEKLIEVVSRLKRFSSSEEKTLPQWADFLEQGAEAFLSSDRDHEADQFFLQKFNELLIELRQFPNSASFPFELIEHFLSRSWKGDLHPSHLHAIRFASLEEGSALPAKAVFLIGMDEESFPRTPFPSSLNLLERKMPTQGDWDRYFFLKALFSASDFLRISYSHFSPEEGKPLSPSLLVQELLTSLPPSVLKKSLPASLPRIKKDWIWPSKKDPLLPQGKITLSLSDLRQLVRHPWKLYLQKTDRIHLEDEPEETFSFQKGKLVRSALLQEKVPLFSRKNLLPTPFREAMELEVEETSSRWTQQLRDWEIEPFSLCFQQSSDRLEKEGSRWTAPPLEFVFPSLEVTVVGEVNLASFKGLVSLNEDNIGSMLKLWPDALAVSIALDAPRIWFLKNGKEKIVPNPLESMSLLIEYYFQSLSAPSPLLPDWADCFLLKGVSELEKKRGRKRFYEDRIADWVAGRVLLPSSEEMFLDWAPLFKKTFGNLIASFGGNRAPV